MSLTLFLPSKDGRDMETEHERERERVNMGKRKEAQSVIASE